MLFQYGGIMKKNTNICLCCSKTIQIQNIKGLPLQSRRHKTICLASVKIDDFWWSGTSSAVFIDNYILHVCRKWYKIVIIWQRTFSWVQIYISLKFVYVASSWQQVSIVSANGLAPSSNKPLTDQKLSDLCHHLASIGHNELKHFHTW